MTDGDPLERILRAPHDGGPAPDAAGPAGTELGRSREGRPVVGYRLGPGGPPGRGGRPGPEAPTRISLIAGCHADEPVGPRRLRRLVACLASLSDDDPLLAGREWWIVPHVNPDGEARNRAWQEAGGRDAPDAYDLPSYLAHAVRELPGDDVEFGFPRGPEDAPEEGAPDRPDPGPRPENRALYQWWRGAEGPFHLHATLHGMGFAAGPWLLLEPTWAERAAPLRAAFRERVRAMGYVLHDVERLGEKGFFRLERGFATRPDSRQMRDHFLARGDPDTAALFRPSSMETIRSLAAARRLERSLEPEAADPLTLVTEMPLFLTPGVGDEPGPPDPAAEEWKERIARWRAALAEGAGPDSVREEARAAGLRPMPVRDQVAMQWEAIAGGIRLVEGPGKGGA